MWSGVEVDRDLSTSDKNWYCSGIGGSYFYFFYKYFVFLN